MTIKDMLAEESLEKHWEYFKQKAGYTGIPEEMLKHMKRSFFAGIAQTTIMILGRSKSQNLQEVFGSIQEQLEIHWQQQREEDRQAGASN